MNKNTLKSISNLTDEGKSLYLKYEDFIKKLSKENNWYVHGVKVKLKTFIEYDVIPELNEYTLEHHLKYIYNELPKRGLSKEKSIALYGEIEGNKRWNEYCNQQAFTNTFEYKNIKYGMSKEEFDEYNKSRAVTLENMISRHGEEKGTYLFQNYCERQIYTNTIEYFIEKYGEEKGIVEFNRINSLKNNSLDNFILRYGEEEGFKKFEKYINNNNIVRYASEEENIFLDKFEKEVDFSKEHSYRQFGVINSSEKVKGNYFKYDYVNTEYRFCIEYNGSIWHGNPLYYNKNDKPLEKWNNQITSEEIWNKDKCKNDLIIEKGIVDKVFIVWDIDNKEEKINEIRQYINSRK